MQKRFTDLDEIAQREKLNQEEANELRFMPEPEENRKAEVTDKREKRKRKEIAGADTIMNRMMQWQFTKEQKAELEKMMEIGIPKAEILAVFYPETDVAEMRKLRQMYEVTNG